VRQAERLSSGVLAWQPPTCLEHEINGRCQKRRLQAVPGPTLGKRLPDRRARGLLPILQYMQSAPRASHQVAQCNDRWASGRPHFAACRPWQHRQRAKMCNSGYRFGETACRNADMGLATGCSGVAQRPQRDSLTEPGSDSRTATATALLPTRAGHAGVVVVVEEALRGGRFGR
jgi:hypothetical protein